ncbi:hypothetical protein CI1B_54440 [Bradyrhizobium ivorense]|uniref:Uncharacterized protein n=1 Tax=Bradyrhizobium ivorense TaxID=2511166 RepID=A0A508TJY0_9BRAD|nr:hypothetical protein CI1B_54440 [Bradyrhizobium ivorense]
MRTWSIQGSVLLNLQLLSIKLEARRSIRGFHGPGGQNGDVNDFAPNTILPSCNHLARNENGLRELAIGPQIGVRKDG